MYAKDLSRKVKAAKSWIELFVESEVDELINLMKHSGDMSRDI